MEKSKNGVTPRASRIYRAAEIAKGLNPSNHPIYISGVGTPFNGNATDWMVWPEDKIGGGLGGAGGHRRIEHGQGNLNDALVQVLKTEARKADSLLKAYADENQAAKLSDVAAAVGQHKLIKVINVSIFGFSRGAALARAFSNEFLKACQVDDQGRKIYCGAPVRIHFMGLFDTVASFGVPGSNVDMPFREKNLVVPQVVERCVHYVAAHELRFSFPVDLIRQRGALKSGWIETVYPGVHSDVGGGYEPVTQGISDRYSRIPMRDMMREAASAGVRILAYDDFANELEALFDLMYKVDPETESSFDKYMASVGVAGSVEETVVGHMKALYSSFGTMTRQKITTPDLLEADGSKLHKIIGHGGIAREAEAIERPWAALGASAKVIYKPGQVLQVIGRTYSMIIKPEPWRIEAWKAAANPDVLHFIRYSVHDSKAGFLFSVEPFSYFRPRGTAESTRNVLAQGLDWLDDTAAEVKQGVINVYHRAEGVVVETYENGILVAKETYAVGEKFVVDTARAGQTFVVDVYETSKEVIITKIEKGKQAFIKSVAVVAKKVSELSGQAVDGVKNMGKRSAQAADGTMKAVDDTWSSTKGKLGF